jgi:glycosyltransferase involved in cell wall biosynthesis
MNNKLLTVITLDEPFINDFAAARNQKLADVKTPWVLYLDSDEMIPPELEQEINKALTGEYDGYLIPRRDIFLGQELRYGETGHTKLIRLARRGTGNWIRPVHEVWQVKGKIGELRHAIIHTPHQSIASFLRKIDRYSTLDAEYRYSEGVRSSIVRIMLYPAGKFLRNYIVLQGFRDGAPGLIMGLMMSFHSYLTWAKLYLLWRKK